MQAEEPSAPAGVKLTDWSDFKGRRQAIFDAVKDSTAKQFPQKYGGVRLELHNLHYAEPDKFSIADQKQALMENKYLHRRLRGTWKLFDDNTNQPLDEREATVMKVPYLTERGTFIHNGSEITTSSQIRLLPGVYARRKANGEMESHFNAKRGTGSSFRINLEPESGLFKLNVGQSSLRLYPLLKDLGVSDKHLEEKWGKELLAKNQAAYDGRVFDKAYQKLVRRPDPKATRDQKVAAIHEALNNTKLDREVVARTLPNLANTKIATAWKDPPMPVPAPQPESKKEGFNKDDYLLLATILNQQFHEGIPTDLPTSELVEHLTAALHDLAPNVNPEMLSQAIDGMRQTG